MWAERRIGDMMIRRYSQNYMGYRGGNCRVCVRATIANMPAKLYYDKTSGSDLYRPKFESFTRSGPSNIRPERDSAR